MRIIRPLIEGNSKKKSSLLQAVSDQSSLATQDEIKSENPQKQHIQKKSILENGSRIRNEQFSHAQRHIDRSEQQSLADLLERGDFQDSPYAIHILQLRRQQADQSVIALQNLQTYYSQSWAASRISQSNSQSSHVQTIELQK